MSAATLILADFLLARIAEDEAQAAAANVVVAARNGLVAFADGSDATLVLSRPRLLAECEAKRRIVALHSPGNLNEDGTVDPDADPSDAEWCRGCHANFSEDWAYRIDECPTKRLLALPYADHPDYRDEWRV